MLRKYPRLLAKASAYFWIPILFSGCIYSTQHFNNGRLLEPGHTSVSLGGGVSHFPEDACPGDSHKWGDTTGTHCIQYTFQLAGDTSVPSYKSDTVLRIADWKSVTKFSLGYRLGVSGKWGPFTGSEIGLHLEAPTNPVSGEFDLKLGLPIPLGLSVWHSLSVGWGIGVWADNSYFLEYAISRSWGANCLFGNYRATYLATQVADLKRALDTRYLNHHQRLIHQASMGFTWTLPKIPIVPDFIVPQAILTYPLGPSSFDKTPEFILDDHVVDFNLGMGWNFK